MNRRKSSHTGQISFNSIKKGASQLAERKLSQSYLKKAFFRKPSQIIGCIEESDLQKSQKEKPKASAKFQIRKPTS